MWVLGQQENLGLILAQQVSPLASRRREKDLASCSEVMD
jgi:hypothetical protein